MMKFLIVWMLLSIGGSVQAHQWTPTYPVLSPSFVDGIYSTRLKLFNGRPEVSYYEIQVLDKDMKSVTFATKERILRLDYLRQIDIEVYIREVDLQNAVYICSRSKLLAEDFSATVISSRICSKIKND
jgi:hypothetical protein